MKLAGMNTQPGEIILTVAVLSILIAAPFGAWAISYTGSRVLKVSTEEETEQLRSVIESDAETTV